MYTGKTYYVTNLTTKKVVADFMTRGEAIDYANENDPKCINLWIKGSWI